VDVRSDPFVPQRTTTRWKAPRFSGTRSPSREGERTRTLVSSTSQAPMALKRSGGARRSGRDSKSFAAAGWRHGGVRQGSRRGAHAMRESFSSALSARIGFGPLRAKPRASGLGGEGFQWPASLAVSRSSWKRWVIGRIVSARCGWRISSGMNTHANATKESVLAREHDSEGGRG